MKAQLEKPNKEISLKVKGQCMDPLIKEGSRVRVRQATKIKQGDIIVHFNEKNELIIHRYGRFLCMKRTKADNNLYTDPWKIKKILGKAVVNESRIQKLKKALQIKKAIIRELLVKNPHKK